MSLARPPDEMWRKVGQMADTTGRIPLWIIGTVTGIPVIGLIGIFFYGNIRFRNKITASYGSCFHRNGCSSNNSVFQFFIYDGVDFFCNMTVIIFNFKIK